MRPSERPALRPGASQEPERQRRAEKPPAPDRRRKTRWAPHTHQPTGKRPEALTGLLLTAGVLLLIEIFLGVATGSPAYIGMLLSVLWAVLIYGVMKRSEDVYKAARFVAYLGLVLNALVIVTSLIELGARADVLDLIVKALKFSYNGVVLFLFPQPKIRDWVLYG